MIGQGSTNFLLSIVIQDKPFPSWMSLMIIQDLMKYGNDTLVRALRDKAKATKLN